MATINYQGKQAAANYLFKERKVFNDPIHGQIEIHPVCVRIIDTPQFQRLRRIKQLDACDLVYPGACHTRFEHSIGTCYLAEKLIRTLQQRQPSENIDERDILCVVIAALCHDLGQGPFSHVFEKRFMPDMNKHFTHEETARKMFEYILEDNDKNVQKDIQNIIHECKIQGFDEFREEDFLFIKELIDKPKDLTAEVWPYAGRDESKSFMYEIVANKRNGIDVDKWDYLLRDSYMLGMKVNFQHERCIVSARIIKGNGNDSDDSDRNSESDDGRMRRTVARKQICYRDKDALNLYDMFYTRMTLHRKAYQHKTHKIIGMMICEALKKANDTVLFHGIEKLLRIADAVKDMKAFTELTDDVFYTILNSPAGDKVLLSSTEGEINRTDLLQQSLFPDNGDENSKNFIEAKNILSDILNRRLFKIVTETQMKNERFDRKTFEEKFLNSLIVAEDTVICYDMVGTFLHLVIGEEDVGEVVNMKICKTANMIKMMLSSKVIKRLEMSMFRTEANALCLGAPQTLSTFIQYWRTHGINKSVTSSEFEDSFGSNSETDSSAARETSDSESSMSSQIPKANSHEEKMVMEYNIGTVEVHVENLIAPHPSRTTRLIDHDHVRMLIDSFSDSSCGQIVVLQGMLTDAAVPHNTLHQEGAGRVEVLGGNHSREALQTLYKKGTLPYSTIRCNLFKPLPRIVALRIGYAHNMVLHEKVKPVSFMDKTRMMRECRPSGVMSKEETLKWKDTLVTVLGVKDRRRLVQSFGVHLAMANLLGEIWAKFCLAAEKTVMSERFLRGFVRLEANEDRVDCLDKLLTEGAASFKNKVKTLIDAGHVKGKKNGKKRKADEIVHEEIQNGEDGTFQDELPLDEGQSTWRNMYEELMVRYKELEKENLELKRKVNKKDVAVEDCSPVEREIQRTRRNCSKNMFKKGEIVMAFWRDESSGEESWQEATILFAHTDGRCRIQWKSDKMISTVVELDYGMQKKDPMENVRFYKKDSDGCPLKIERNQVSYVLPDTFAENILRIYVRNIHHDVKDALFPRIQSKFLDWCRENDLPPPKGQNTIPKRLQMPDVNSERREIQEVNSDQQSGEGDLGNKRLAEPDLF